MEGMTSIIVLWCKMVICNLERVEKMTAEFKETERKLNNLIKSNGKNADNV
ncbi:unnamed protein product [marine sediment metagenome]|uniref:Uncharacterized protein n=1 Tax=marine sediment metagenome TaxID=412755 RepID=X0V4R6_9ZZZZ